MNSTDLVFKPCSTLHGGQLLNVHLNSMTPDGNWSSLSFFSFGRPRHPFLLQNAQNGTAIGPWETLFQLLGNSDRAMVLMLRPVVNYRSTVLRADNRLRRERSRTLVQGAFPIRPSLDGSGINPKTFSQVANAHSFFMQPFNLLTLFQCQGSLGMEFHGFPLLTQAY
jgi:hypothetical protein